MKNQFICFLLLTFLCLSSGITFSIENITTTEPLGDEVITTTEPPGDEVITTTGR